MQSTEVTIQLQLTADGESVSGTAQNHDLADAPRRQFSGWMGLVAAIDSVVDEAREAAVSPQAAASAPGPAQADGA
jgi:hypothetical protein